MDLTPLQRYVSDRQLAGLVIKCRLWDQGSMARCGKMYAATTEKAVQDTSNPLSPYYSVIWFWQYTQLPRSSIYRLDWCTDRWFRTWLSYVHPSWCHSPHQSVRVCVTGILLSFSVTRCRRTLWFYWWESLMPSLAWIEWQGTNHWSTSQSRKFSFTSHTMREWHFRAG